MSAESNRITHPERYLASIMTTELNDSAPFEPNKIKAFVLENWEILTVLAHSIYRDEMSRQEKAQGSALGGPTNAA